jgi:type I protein arginine methyltransferase
VEYSIADYGSMIEDAVRTDAYARALSRVVTPGSVVIDIGTGTGIAALIACRLGARRVFAIEPSPVIEVARQVAMANGLSDRIEFFQESSERVELPELADVIVSDLHGLLPFHGRHIPLIADARRRLLKPDGVLIPQRDTVWCAPVDAQKAFEMLLGVWRTRGMEFDFEVPRTLVANGFWKTDHVVADDLLGEPQLVATLDYASGAACDASASMSFQARRDGRLHGLCVWFDAQLLDDIGFSNAPGASTQIYGRTFFPIPEQVEIAKGEHIHVELAANLVADEYVFRWNVTVGAQNEPRARFRQSTFAGMPLSARALHASSEGYAPVLDEKGARVLKALGLMNGQHTVAEIASALENESFPRDEALALAGSLSEKYSAQSD